ncbi:MAG: UDP-N-acetylglucosamine 1-carboxyvinyltransferase, partial [Planctomycetota bacterium]|nr:UDP-N-acetylglucosamine 1-carboxyvinyltransferase [Planctomycetota bacterium]
ILLLAPLLHRFGRVEMPFPGGDRIGRRRIDTHLLALQSLGARVEVGANIRVSTPAGITGAHVLLDEASVTATEKTVMAAVLGRGATIIQNAACEPHVQDLCRFLKSMGADISGIGTNELQINGVKRLHGADVTLGADYIEVASFIALAAVTGSELLIKEASPENLRMILYQLRRLGVDVEIHGDDVFVPRHQRLEIQTDYRGAIPKIDDAPWPGFPADLTSVATVLATQCRGSVIIFEKMFESRMFFVDQLLEMGAQIVLCDPHRAVVIGPARLHGARMTSPDIRAGMALLIASLSADGVSTIGNIGQIDRGYERIDERLRTLGAHIQRVAE